MKKVVPIFVTALLIGTPILSTLSVAQTQPDRDTNSRPNDPSIRDPSGRVVPRARSYTRGTNSTVTEEQRYRLDRALGEAEARATRRRE